MRVGARVRARVKALEPLLRFVLGRECEEYVDAARLVRVRVRARVRVRVRVRVRARRRRRAPGQGQGKG